MAIIKQYHKDTDTTYVYESISYWDAEKKQSRSKRKCIGKIDPETGEIVPTGRRGRKKKTAESESQENDHQLSVQYDQAIKEIDLLKAKLIDLEAHNQALTSDNQKLHAKLREILCIAQNV